MGNCLFNSRVDPTINPVMRQQTINPVIRQRTINIIPPVYNPPWNFKEVCIVCMDRKINTVCMPCGHCIMCYLCNANLCSTKYNNTNGVIHYPRCPMCRENIEAISLLYPKLICVDSIANIIIQ